MRVRNVTRNTVLGSAIAVASDSSERRRGLLEHDSMPPGSGLWITPCEAVHTFFMRFPIDVVFLSRKLVVVKVRAHVAPWRMAGALRAHSVLELPAGMALQTGTQAGDQLEFAEESP